MTLTEGLAKAAGDIDRILRQRHHDLVLQMISDGADPRADVLPRQQELNSEWRQRLLDEVGDTLIACGVR
jgi:hypothetical protein